MLCLDALCSLLPSCNQGMPMAASNQCFGPCSTVTTLCWLLLCCVMQQWLSSLCHAALCYAALCYAIFCCIALCCAMLCCAMLCCVMLRCALLSCNVLCCASIMHSDLQVQAQWCIGADMTLPPVTIPESLPAESKRVLKVLSQMVVDCTQIEAHK